MRTVPPTPASGKTTRRKAKVPNTINIVGTMSYPDGSRYEGEFRDNAETGQGRPVQKPHRPNGILQRGQV